MAMTEFEQFEYDVTCDRLSKEREKQSKNLSVAGAIAPPAIFTFFLLLQSFNENAQQIQEDVVDYIIPDTPWQVAACVFLSGVTVFSSVYLAKIGKLTAQERYDKKVEQIKETSTRNSVLRL